MKRNGKPFTENSIYKIRKSIIKVTLFQEKPILRNPPKGLKIVDKEYVINYEEQKLIDLFKELYQQSLSFEEITKQANAVGFKNRKNGKIWINQTKRILKRLNL